MFKSRSVPGAMPAITLVVPTTALRDLIRRNRERLLPGCNYANEWRDAQGYGIHLAVSPPSPAIKQPRPWTPRPGDRGYDLFC